VLAQDDLAELVVFGEEDNVIAQQAQKAGRSKKALTLRSKSPGCSSFQLKRFLRLVTQVTP